ncbi:MAG: tryptophan 2,3-dioxygenase family protein [Crocinitomicaceae bacterium]
METILNEIKQKYLNQQENPATYLKGLLYSKPITYWDYVQTDTLLSIQNTRTDFPDEMVFLMYHQVNELLFKMILWEIEQVSSVQELTIETFSEKLKRVSRYFDMLTTSFEIMGDGMSKEQYLQFRDSLTPASGFQSAQYRKIEFASTNIENLLMANKRGEMNDNWSISDLYNNLYWQIAGIKPDGTLSVLMQQFQSRYKDEFFSYIIKMKENNLYAQFLKIRKEESDQYKDLIKNMRHFDHTVNVKWTIAHLEAAAKYLDVEGDLIDSTGGSDWKKYMHPKYQRRIFFPSLWSEEELKNWGTF